MVLERRMLVRRRFLRQSGNGCMLEAIHHPTAGVINDEK
jgi:hypothetical protein